ncbi:hypothetical protein BDR26DRAFT_867559 [Obelidium mucronatum]|nr:hypothetical protein BDR26DRAFT_867559 [Obelidium mucronatum]
MVSPRRSKTFNESEPIFAPRLSSSVGISFKSNADGIIANASAVDSAAAPPPLPPVVFITGCSKGGIGHALCIEFAKKGCRVFGTVRRMEALSDLSEFSNPQTGSNGGGGGPGGGRIEMLPMDVTDLESIRRAVRAVVGRTGHIDILVNNAGIGLCGGIVESNIGEVRSVFETNVIGLISVTQEVAPYMIDRGQGKIVNIGSMLAYVSIPWSAAYCSSKSAVRAITSSLRMELAPLGIQVVLVSAGSVKSNLKENMDRRAEKIPSNNKLYHKRATQHTTAAVGSSSSGGTETQEFAFKVVSQILVPTPEINLMLGKWWWVVILLLQFPEWLIEWLVKWRYNLFGVGK